MQPRVQSLQPELCAKKTAAAGAGVVGGSRASLSQMGTAQSESGAGSLLQGSPPGHIHSDRPPTKTQVAFSRVVCHQWALTGNDKKVLWAEHKLASNRIQTV